MSGNIRVDAHRPDDVLNERRHPEDSFLLPVIKKVAAFALALFASIISFTVLPPQIALVFSAIFLLSSFGYMLNGSTPVMTTPEPVVYMQPYVRPYYSYIPIFPSFWTSPWRAPATTYVPGATFHAPVATRTFTPPSRRYTPPPPSAPYINAPVRQTFSATQGHSPLNRTPQQTPPSSWFSGPCGGGQSGRTAAPDGAIHAPVGRRNR